MQGRMEKGQKKVTAKIASMKEKAGEDEGKMARAEARGKAIQARLLLKNKKRIAKFAAWAKKQGLCMKKITAE